MHLPQNKHIAPRLALLWAIALYSCDRTPAPSKFSFPQSGTPVTPAINVGDSFPPLSGTTLKGDELSIDFSGSRVTLVICWATWCGPCMAALPNEIELWHRYNKMGLQVVGINADDDIDTAKKAEASLGIPFESFADRKSGPIQDTLGIDSWPTLLLVDSSGTVIHGSPVLSASTVRINQQGTKEEVKLLNWALEDVLGKPPPQN